VSVASLLLIFLSVGSYVAGQLFIKRAMQTAEDEAVRHGRFASWLTAGIGGMTISFFLTLGLLQRFDLSYLYPFNGLSVIFITLAASILLKERLTLRLATGALVISLGVALVSIS
jgi:drug/metabolite transporter (DMT)-like permease